MRQLIYLSALSRGVQLGHVPDDGLLRLEVDLGTDKPTEIHTLRSQLIGRSYWCLWLMAFPRTISAPKCSIHTLDLFCITRRDALVGVLALKTALNKKWEELRKLLVDPKAGKITVLSVPLCLGLVESRKCKHA